MAYWLTGKSNLVARFNSSDSLTRKFLMNHQILIVSSPDGVLPNYAMGENGQ
jgi:hypothetical protein